MTDNNPNPPSPTDAVTIRQALEFEDINMLDTQVFSSPSPDPIQTPPPTATGDVPFRDASEEVDNTFDDLALSSFFANIPELNMEPVKKTRLFSSAFDDDEEEAEETQLRSIYDADVKPFAAAASKRFKGVDGTASNVVPATGTDANPADQPSDLPIVQTMGAVPEAAPYQYDPTLRPYRATMVGTGFEVVPEKDQDSNRAFRLFPANRFLILCLRPIDNYKDAMGILNAKIKYTFENGETKTWTFLGSNDSRIRSREGKSVLYFEETPGCTVVDVLNSFGDLETVLQEHGIGKYFARLSLNFSSTVSTIEIADNEVGFIPDIDAPDGKAYTDGCGCITRSAAARVCQALGLQTIPSVLQFRFAGCKGVFVVYDPTALKRWFPDQYREDIAIYLRPSQIKYSAWQFRTLDIHNWSRPRKTFKTAKLQKAMIRILVDLGIPLTNIKILLQTELERLQKVLNERDKTGDWLLDKESTLSAVTSFRHEVALRMLAAGHDLSEPRLRQILGSLLSKELNRLCDKMHLPIPGSIYLYGICDETDTLEEDHVYAHAGPDGFLQGTIVITRSPLSHPGDIRTVTAVAPPKGSPYESCMDVCVFPRKGFQPLADKMSGGDLDGDMFFISWNSLIIPNNIDPANPRSKAADLIEEEMDRKDCDATGNALVRALKRYIGNRIVSFDIGETAKRWEDAAETAAMGSRDPYCLALSERYEACLDASKKGKKIAPLPRPEDLRGPLVMGQGPITDLTDIILAERANIVRPWSNSQNTTPKEAFALDPDLAYFPESHLFSETYAKAQSLIKLYWRKFFELQKHFQGGNKPMFGFERTNNTSKRAAKEKRQIDEVFQEKLDIYMEELKVDIFHPDQVTPEFNKENTIKASACIAAVYNRLASGLSGPIEMGWWGEPWLNALKAHRVKGRLDGFGPAPAIAPTPKVETIPGSDITAVQSHFF